MTTKKTIKKPAIKKGKQKVETKKELAISPTEKKLSKLERVRLQCLRIVMENGLNNDIADPVPKAEKLFKWVLDEEAQDFSDL